MILFYRGAVIIQAWVMEFFRIKKDVYSFCINARRHGKWQAGKNFVDIEKDLQIMTDMVQ